MNIPSSEQAVWARALATELRERAQRLASNASAAAIQRLYREADKFDLLAMRLARNAVSASLKPDDLAVVARG